MEERLGERLTEPASRERSRSHDIPDLGAPVAGAAERIAALIAEDGGTIPGGGDDVPALLRTLADLCLRGGRRTPPSGRPAIACAKRIPFSPRPDLHRYGAARTWPASAVSAYQRPAPLINMHKNLLVLWSPKSACTTVYVWFAKVSGFADDVRAFAKWPHRHRIHQYLRSALYHDSALSGMINASPLKIIRCPYGRAVSIYRHALQTDFADIAMEAWSGGKISAGGGYSFQTFLDLLETLDMARADIHFRPQFHPLERERKPAHIVNISTSDLFADLNRFEESQGLPRTDFSTLTWLTRPRENPKSQADFIARERTGRTPLQPQ